MIYSIIYILLAAMALGILIFIHELGHYFMELKEGMKVEAFSIGFGRPIYTWEHRGVKWQIGMLPFGGYVRIAGMEKQGSIEPYQIPDGFYGKRPLSRIKVALMGPIVNIVFAFLLFCVIWAAGGRDKPFSEYTHLLGWVDPSSKLYEMGVRPGDQITELDKRPFEGFNQFLYSALLEKSNPDIRGMEMNYFTGQKTPFDYEIPTGSERGLDKAAITTAMVSPASFLIYARHPDGSANLLPAGSPMEGSGLQYNDRILWVDGQLIFSKKQLVSVINEPKALLTVQRGDQIFLSRVPRVSVRDLKMTLVEKAELEDWRFAAGFKDKVEDLYFLPYDISSACVVESTLSYLNEDLREQTHAQMPRSALEVLLQRGDKILAVDGKKIVGAQELLTNLQKREVQIIVQREVSQKEVSWQEADNSFFLGVNFSDLQAMSSTIGTDGLVKEKGNLVLLSPVEPKPLTAFPLPDSIKTRLAADFMEQKKRIEKMDNPQEKAFALRLLEENQKKLMLGVVLQDEEVQFNPSPFSMFGNVFDETWRTLKALVTGYLSPKYMSGPVGIVQALHYGWMVGVKEALFWIAVISLNLGIINLLPIPVLDGGHICFSLWEAVTKKPIKAKTMERFILPFIILLIVFFVYLTYNDILRLMSRFF